MVDESGADANASGGHAEPPQPDTGPASYDEAVDQLDGLVRQHALGQLSGDEFQEKRLRLLSSL